MSDRRVFRWATTSARLLAATVASAVAVVAVVTAISIPWPTVTHEPVRVSATPGPAATVIVCDGGLLTLGRDASAAGQLSAVTAQTVTGGVAPGAPEPEESRLAMPALEGAEGPLVLTAQPQGRTRTDVAASGSATVRAADLAGFAASACRPPLMESWLVGGSAATGAADLVIVSNPGAVPATVQLTVYGADGAQTPPGGENLIVAAGTQRVIPLAGLVLGEAAPVIRVSAVGAPVHASLQASITRVLTPGGVDQISAAAAPETSQTIAGVTVSAAPGAEGASDAPAVVRVLSPAADATATVTVTAIGTALPVLTPEVVPLVAGQPTEVALSGLPVGAYAVQVDADQPVVAAVWTTTGFGRGDDFAWYAASPLITVPTLFATSSGPLPALSLVNTAAEPVVVTVESNDELFSLEVTVPAAGSTTVRLSPRTVYALESGGIGIRAALSFTGDGALAGFPIWPADAATPPIVVYP